jgi:hypothetical protein
VEVEKSQPGIQSGSGNSGRLRIQTVTKICTPHNFEPIVRVDFELWIVSRNVGYANVDIGTK